MNDAFAMEGMSTRYGWTPEYIKKLKEKDHNTYMIYMSILAGESDSAKAKEQTKNGSSSGNKIGNPRS